MRRLTTAAVLEELLTRLGRAARAPVDVFLTGGATAVLYGWRETTIDVDLKLVPSADELLRAIADLKERLHLNVELAAPDEFIPELPGWRERSVFIRREGHASFFHYDPYAQALAKIERGHAQDLGDVENLLGSGLVEQDTLLALFERIEPELYRYPAIDPGSFRQKVEATLRDRP